METEKLNPKNYEQKWMDFWGKHEFFHADSKSDKPSFSILIPPPNVTDRLHMGHGLNVSIQDILIRWKRMLGHNCMWLPGTDHAGIATQMMVEKALLKEGKNRQDIGREEFVKKCVSWKEDKGGIIVEQLKKLGASCDWKREAYTMDEKLSKAVRKIFVDLYKDGLIYRGERLVNWDPSLETALSDDEVENREVKGSLWHIKYPLEGKNGHLTVATTRPETMFGDVAVAVNPEDERYKNLVGQSLVLPIANRKIPIIADNYVDKEFGTGCVKITPAHDKNDFLVGVRHKLSPINIMDKKACLNSNCPESFVGFSREKARKAVSDTLTELGLIDKIESYAQTVPVSQRSSSIIEPRLSKQWFVKMQSFVDPAINYLKEDKIKFHPDLWKKTYFHWLENIQDWCISRQLWWGHRMPIWYCKSCDGVSTGVEDVTTCESCGSEDLFQDEDVLDTWFSSWLWPVSPFGWPEDTKDLNKFFPSNVLVTGAEILFLWVARMIMVSHYIKKSLPFEDVYFNSIICDKSGKKFSKTLGNGIDPLEMIDKHGADAVRFVCVSLAPLGGRVRMNKEDFIHGSRFVNKIWNAFQFVQKQITQSSLNTKSFSINSESLAIQEKWLITELLHASARVNKNLKEFQINSACDEMYRFIWHSFCDWGIELAKFRLQKNPEQAEKTLSVMIYVFDGLLRLSAPFMPFISEEIWHQLPHSKEWDRPSSLVFAKFPDANSFKKFDKESKKWEKIMSLIAGIRSIRTQSGISPQIKLNAYVKCDEEFAQLINESSSEIDNLSATKIIESAPTVASTPSSLVFTGAGWSVYVSVEGHLDFKKEINRLSKEASRMDRIIKGLEAKINNPKFVDHAPKDVVDKTKSQLDNLKSQKKAVEEARESLSG